MVVSVDDIILKGLKNCLNYEDFVDIAKCFESTKDLFWFVSPSNVFTISGHIFLERKTNLFKYFDSIISN